IDRQRSIEEEKGKKKKRKRRRRRRRRGGGEVPRAALAATPLGGSPASRRRPRVLFSPREETVSPRGREFEATHGVPKWSQFKSVLLLRFGMSEYENIDGQLVKIRQTSIVQEYQTRFAKGLCWHYNQPWSHGHRCKKGMLLMIEPIEESKEEDPEPEEDTKKDMQLVVSTVHALAGYTNPQAMKIEGFLEQQPVIVLIDTKSTNNFMNNKVAARLMFQKEDYSEFNVKVADDRILKCNQK
ncbi:hypothetical protein GW17_00059267, partial [Ensete ventricosum]